MRALTVSSGGRSDPIETTAYCNAWHQVNAHRLAFPQTLGSVQTCIIVDGVPISFAKQYQQLGVSWCSIGDGCVLPSFVEDAHSRGIGVMASRLLLCLPLRRPLASLPIHSRSALLLRRSGPSTTPP